MKSCREFLQIIIYCKFGFRAGQIMGFCGVIFFHLNSIVSNVSILTEKAGILACF